MYRVKRLRAVDDLQMLEFHRVQVDGFPDPLDFVFVDLFLLFEHFEVALEFGTVEPEIVFFGHTQQNLDTLGHERFALGNNQVIIRQTQDQLESPRLFGLPDQLLRVLGLENRVVETAEHARNGQSLR